VLTVDEAFKKFKSRLEISTNEQQAASRRQRKLREQLDDSLDIAHDFLTGAYARDTKTKPLRDVDIFVELGAEELRYRDQHPSQILTRVRDVLVPHYGVDRVVTDRRCVRVDYGLILVDDASDDVMSCDVVPAFAKGDAYEIPDDTLGEWITTDPRVHADRATEANKTFSGQWKPIVKMAKKWNQYNGEPVEPSFLIEVLALRLLDGPWGGRYPYELRQFFASAADRLADGWADPAQLGPAVSDVLDGDSHRMDAARNALSAAESACTEALRLERSGRTGDALTEWQRLFGPTFSKS
jgi:predicted nucleotidyltransferase